ncbi:MAG: hypothetical protein IJ151_07730 [Bacteroidales bacterium]|nr:hypothetical protein [Bacteroidales bacterium]
MKKRKIWIIAAVLVILSGIGIATCCTKENPTEDSSRFVAITDVVPDAILEIRYYGTYNFVGARIDGYLAPTALLTKEAAAALKAVSDDVIAQGYRLKIYDAYRPQKGVDHFVLSDGATLQFNIDGEQQTVKTSEITAAKTSLAKRQVLSFGNSGGDSAMHNYCLSNSLRSDAFMLIADDPGRLEELAGITADYGPEYAGYDCREQNHPGGYQGKRAGLHQ